MPGYQFHHVHLYSPDPIKTADFYEKFFGATRRRPDREVDEGSLEDGPPFYAVQLVLNGVGIFVRSQKEGATIPGAPVRGLEHFGLYTDDLEAAVADLTANGVEVEVRNPYIAFIRGPDNVRIELQAVGRMT